MRIVVLNRAELGYNNVQCRACALGCPEWQNYSLEEQAALLRRIHSLLILLDKIHKKGAKLRHSRLHPLVAFLFDCVQKLLQVCADTLETTPNVPRHEREDRGRRNHGVATQITISSACSSVDDRA